MLRLHVYMAILTICAPVLILPTQAAGINSNGGQAMYTTVYRYAAPPEHPQNDDWRNPASSDTGKYAKYANRNVQPAPTEYANYAYNNAKPASTEYVDYVERRPYADVVEYVEYPNRYANRYAKSYTDGYADSYAERYADSYKGQYLRNDVVEHVTVYEEEAPRQKNAVHRQIRNRNRDDSQNMALNHVDDQDTILVREAEEDVERQQEEVMAKRSTLEGVRKTLVDSGLIPDVLPDSFKPEFNITLRFNNQPVSMGEILTPNDTRNEPTIEFDGPLGQAFTVAIVDADNPSMAKHGYRSYRHFLASNLDNVPGSINDIITPYQAPQPAFGTGLHRFAVTVLKQNDRFNVTDSDIPKSRVRFDVNEWGKAHKMRPVAATFFLVKRQHQNERVDTA
ncbi:hypothetical protein LPJ66_000386 [Kickxella alabastrina]|uniref:Uncharacterized protein n=1 Tax=Kickxella alabastrina TaxID=61397 RepID=A0ACC1IW55_9FUNG|nr:hypothetical protein LPJ66_000386 [Kickxella alabastrina]